MSGIKSRTVRSRTAEPQALTLKCLGIHRKILNKLPLTSDESTGFLVHGNIGFAEFIRSLGRVNLAKRSEELPEELWLVCSDARAGLIINPKLQVEHRLAIAFSAGNALSLEQPASRAILASLLSRIRTGSTVRIIGHANCGAVDHADGEGNLRSPPGLRSLLDSVEPTNEMTNIALQLERVRSLAASVGAEVTVQGNLFDWNNPEQAVEGNGDPVTILNETFRTRSLSRFVRGLETQYAHAVLVSGVNGYITIPFTLREVFSVHRPNEVFCVTANELLSEGPGFDDLSTGSILYSLINNQTTNIVLVHADEVVLAAWKEELNKWFHDLSRSNDVKEALIAERYFAGEIAITCMLYDIQKGTVEVVN